MNKIICTFPIKQHPYVYSNTHMSKQKIYPKTKYTSKSIKK